MVGKRALALAIVSTALAALHSALTPMAWVDSAHVAMRYARRISDHGTVTLLGQAEPVVEQGRPDPDRDCGSEGPTGVDRSRVDRWKELLVGHRRGALLADSGLALHSRARCCPAAWKP